MVNLCLKPADASQDDGAAHALLRHYTAATAPPGCWLDIYQRPRFGGTLRRFHGPGSFRDLDKAGIAPGSLIVGPAAIVLDSYGKTLLQPGQLIADASRFARLSRLAAFDMLHVRAHVTPR